MKTAIIFGIGNIGSVLIKELPKAGVHVKYVVRSSHIFDIDLNKIIDKSEWRKCAASVDLGFICIPTQGTGAQAFEYESALFLMGKPVVTCEKASLACHWDTLKNYRKILKYTASVGGGTRMLREISRFNPEEIQEIKAVVNGTLNYIGDGLRQGKEKDTIVKEVLEKGYAEPGAATFEEIMRGEIQDVVLKSVILANHSGMFEKIIETGDIEVVDFKEGRRCIVKITKDTILAGFIEEAQSPWLPSGVQNVLYINGEKTAYGPGAGAAATVQVMIEDYADLARFTLSM